MSKQRVRFAGILLTAAVFLAGLDLSGLVFQAAPAAANHEPSLQQADAPDTVVSEPLLEWALADPMLYWADRCVPGPDAATAGDALDHLPLRRMPINGGARRTLDTSHNDDCLDYQSITADDTAVYYFNQDAESIQMIPIGQPDQSPVTLATGVPDVSTELVVRDGFVYFGTFSKTVRRVSTAGGAPALVVNSAQSPRDLDFSGDRLFWIDSDGVWWVDLPCNGCPPRQYSDDEGGKWLLVNQSIVVNSGLFWVVAGGFNQPDQIRTQIPIINGVRDITIYTGPQNYRIGDLTALYPGFMQGLSYLYWTESLGGSQDLVRRYKPGADGAEVIAEIDGNLDHRVRVHGGDVYFARIDNGNEAILKLPFDAEALARDARVAGWEVTQAVQNLDNGVPLVANKPTFVRVYGDQGDGNLKSGVEAWLEGYQDGNPLPGSPLAPINGQQRLETGKPYDRTGATAGREGWLFELPGSWDDDGSIELRAVVDPRHSFSDPDPANNVVTGAFAFAEEPDPCLFFWPVETHAPLPHHTDPNFWDNIDRLESMWPVDDVDVLWVGEPIRELEACLDWDLHCWGPWELDQGWEVTNFPPDKDRLIFKLMLRHAISTLESPFYCDDFGSVHTVGMVHGNSNTGSTTGFANFLIGASWVKFADANAGSTRPWNEPTSGATLAQELTHNFWRYHVGCLPNEDSFFGLGDWPYTDRCKLDDRSLTAASTHFGFDPLTRAVVRPDGAGDYMTYRSARWVSDYTFKDVQGIFGTIFDVRAASVDSGQEMILTTGVYESVSGLGRLYYSYVLPDTMLSDSTTGTPPASRAAHPHHSPGEEPHAQLRLRAADGSLLAEHEVELVAPDNHGADYAAYVFAAQVPKPDGEVGRIELVVDDRVVDTRIPSANAPSVEIIAPTADATLGEEITLRWRANDADGDELLFSVNYSPDDGTTWLPLTTEYPGDVGGDVTSLTLASPDTLPGSAGKIAYLRVIASDGYHTTVAEAGPFTVTDRAPTAIIQTPGAEAWLDPVEPVLVRGRGYDAEAGVLSGEALAWTLDDQPIGSGDRQTLHGLAPGTHSLALTVTDAGGQSATQTTIFEVLPLSIPEAASTPGLDGRCNDSAYLQSPALSLQPYEAGGQAVANLARRGDDLWVCLTGLERSQGEQISLASLRMDVDNSRDALAQADDYLFTLGEDGTPSVHHGDGAGAFDQPAPVDYRAEVAANGATWSAEFHVPGADLALWQNAFGLAFGHERTGTPAAARVWPYAAQAVRPDTWAEVAAVAVPFIQGMVPISATLGAEDVVVALDGRRFGPNPTLMANGLAQSTVISSATQLSATLDSSLFQTAGTIRVTAVFSDANGYESNPLTLTVYNPVPSLNSLAPSTVESGASATTVVVTGENFVEGAVAMWHGQARPTRRIDAQTLEVDLQVEDLAYARTVGITVLNPEPRLQSSNTLPFIVSQPQLEPIFLPLVER